MCHFSAKKLCGHTMCVLIRLRSSRWSPYTFPNHFHALYGGIFSVALSIRERGIPFRLDSSQDATVKCDSRCCSSNVWPSEFKYSTSFGCSFFLKFLSFYLVVGKHWQLVTYLSILRSVSQCLNDANKSNITRVYMRTRARAYNKHVFCQKKIYHHLSKIYGGKC